MNEKHHEVSVWLDKLYGGDVIPQYEINKHTIEILHNLMKINTKQDEFSAVMKEDLLQKADEYAVEAERLNNVLSRLGVAPSSLSESGTSSLHTLTNAAQLLEVKDASNSSLLLALSEQSTNLMTLQEESKSQQKLSQKLFSKTKEALQRTSTLQKALDDLEEQTSRQGPQLEQKAKEASFLQSKAREYRSHIVELQDELKTSGVDPSVFHERLVQKEEELKKLKEKLHPLKAKLDSYHQLPPDLALARVKVEEAKRELHHLEEEVTKKINLMHM